MNTSRRRLQALLALAVTSSRSPSSPLAAAGGDEAGRDDGRTRGDDGAAAETTPPAETAGRPASGLGSEFDVASAGDVTIKLWWLGDLEAPGIEPWMDQMVQQFQSEYPNVTVETTLYETGKWIQTQQTACQSGSGPDLWYNWSGTWSLELAWKGCTVPNETILSPADLEANPSVAGDAVGGPDVGLPALQVRVSDRGQPRPARAGRARSERSARDVGRVDRGAGARSRRPESRRSRSGSRTGSAGRSPRPVSSRSSG